MVGMMWKTASSCGWEHFDCARGPGFESYVCYLLMLLFCYLNLWKHVLVYYDNWIVIPSKKCEFG